MHLHDYGFLQWRHFNNPYGFRLLIGGEKYVDPVANDRIYLYLCDSLHYNAVLRTN